MTIRNQQSHPKMDILSEAIKLLGSAPAENYERRGWAHWFCPFHEDTGRPNFGINYRSESGYWKCLSCNRKGPSYVRLAPPRVAA